MNRIDLFGYDNYIYIEDILNLKNQKQKTYKLFFTNSTKNCTSPTRNARKENSD